MAYTSSEFIKQNSIEHIENSESDRPIVDCIRESIQELKEHPVLNLLESGGLTKEEYQYFVVGRLMGTKLFVPLLEVGRDRAKDVKGGKKLAEELELNRRDEMGEDRETGENIEGASHDIWRKDLCDALDIDESVKQSMQDEGVRDEYERALKAIIAGEGTSDEREKALRTAGFIYWLESTIPVEFVKILNGLARVFPDKFVSVKDYDPSALPPEKAKSSRYLGDHIHHDAKAHSKDLKEALKPFLENEIDRSAVLRGMNEARKARQSFYKNMERSFEGKDNPFVGMSES